MHHSESIILSKRPLGEADLLLTFFSKDGGKLKGVARHAKKSRKRFGGVLEIGYIVDIHHFGSQSSDLHKITQASLLAPTSHSVPSLSNTTALWLALEMAGRFLPDHEENEEKYELLKRFVVALHEGRINRGVMIFFLLKWITLCGFMPDFDDINSAIIGLRFNQETADTMKRIVSGDIKFDISNSQFEDMLGFIFKYCTSILGRPLKLESYLPMLMDITNG